MSRGVQGSYLATDPAGLKGGRRGVIFDGINRKAQLIRDLNTLQDYPSNTVNKASFRAQSHLSAQSFGCGADVASDVAIQGVLMTASFSLRELLPRHLWSALHTDVRFCGRGNSYSSVAPQSTSDPAQCRTVLLTQCEEPFASCVQRMSTAPRFLWRGRDRTVGDGGS